MGRIFLIRRPSQGKIAEFLDQSTGLRLSDNPNRIARQSPSFTADLAGTLIGLGRNTFERVKVALAAALLLSSSFPAVARKVRLNREPEKKPVIARLKDENHVEDCGCSFGFPSQGKVSEPGSVLALSPDNKIGWMNIDGQDVKLNLVRDAVLKVARIGKRFSRTFVSGGIKVVVIQTITRMCVPYSSNCEWTGYRATVIVRKDGRVQQVSLDGECGCM